MRLSLKHQAFYLNKEKGIKNKRLFNIGKYLHQTLDGIENDFKIPAKLY